MMRYRSPTHRYPDRSKKKKDKVIRLDIVMNAFLVSEKETSTSSSPVSVCYNLVTSNPKFTGVATVLNRVVAKAASKANVAPLVEMKEKVEKILAEYDPDAGPEVPIAEATFKGFDHHGRYDSGEHTDTDRAKKEEAEKLLHDWWMQRMNPKMGWTEMFKEDGSRLDHGLSGYHAYFADRGRTKALAAEVLDSTYTAETRLMQIPIPIPTISDRESLYRSVNGDIGDEIKRKEEPKIELYSKEDDLIYRNRIGKEDELSDSDEEEGGKSTRREDVVSKSKHDKALAAKDKAMQELREKMNKEMSVVKKRAEQEKKKAEAASSQGTKRGDVVRKAEHEKAMEELRKEHRLAMEAKDRAMRELVAKLGVQD
ncbi:hypothetical protein TeGR_g4367 [Tetraparma gracilis]|uniref:Uncharacterized protein n=1 Tax=Tetraparma gracilis TaxID=2962635 RepID=A0ABQ6NCR1_9STRA|nr:hypothetical protein TeGR_g4367 [Tetraparma gracilis]